MNADLTVNTPWKVLLKYVIAVVWRGGVSTAVYVG